MTRFRSGALIASLLALCLGMALPAQAVEVDTSGGWAYEEVGSAKYQLVWIKGMGISGSVTSGCTPTAAAPTYTEDVDDSLSCDLAGNVRFTMGTTLAYEDQDNQLAMTSGGKVRIDQIVGTGGVPSTASDATTLAMVIPTGKKTFLAVETCTGTCVQTQKIYGAFESSATVAKSVLVCTLSMNASTTAVDWCDTERNFSYWFVVTSATSGTTPLVGTFVQY